MFICIWCEDKNRGIGLLNQIPWVNKTDLKMFQTLTTNNFVVMGKNTFLSLKKPLANRVNIVCSKTLANQEGITILNDIDDFIATHQDSKEVFYIIGGKQIYNKFLEKSKIIVVSVLDDEYECDLFMDNSFANFNLKKVKFFNDFHVLIYVNKKCHV